MSGIGRVIKWFAIATAVLAALVLVGGLVIYSRISGMEVERVSEDLHVITGAGGNVAVLATSEGAVVVDSMSFEFQGEAIRARAEELTGEPVVLVINTHYHLDHTHGNPAFAPGTRVVSTARTLHHLTTRDAWYWNGDAAGLLPNETFELERELRVGDKTLRLYHPGRGHTDGDLVVLFVEERVIHMGDLFFNRSYPNIDLEAGGSVRDWGDSLEQVFPLEFDRVIPGHGPTTDRVGLRQFQRFMRQLAKVGAEAARAGWSAERTLAEGEFDEDEGYEPMEIPLVLQLDRDFVLRRSWEEATGAVKAD
ncbi:MAG: MBL fold metallo-hydrolase [Deltaproteobacteria bacterium]|nr:MBL fold metallo-hydrolase [Deltaproteobacteria bacterium]MBW2418013.1 MBL fold metallo-hydrolase [Deltaproteobacteria bacterium]